MVCAERLIFEACTDGIKLHRRVGGINETGSATILGEIEHLCLDALGWTRAACLAYRGLVSRADGLSRVPSEHETAPSPEKKPVRSSSRGSARYITTASFAYCSRGTPVAHSCWCSWSSNGRSYCQRSRQIARHHASSCCKAVGWQWLRRRYRDQPQSQHGRRVHERGRR